MDTILAEFCTRSAFFSQNNVVVLRAAQSCIFEISPIDGFVLSMDGHRLKPLPAPF